MTLPIHSRKYCIDFLVRSFSLSLTIYALFRFIWHKKLLRFSLKRVTKKCYECQISFGKIETIFFRVYNNCCVIRFFHFIYLIRIWVSFSSFFILFPRFCRFIFSLLILFFFWISYRTVKKIKTKKVFLFIFQPFWVEAEMKKATKRNASKEIETIGI